MPDALINIFLKFKELSSVPDYESYSLMQEVRTIKQELLELRKRIEKLEG